MRPLLLMLGLFAALGVAPLFADTYMLSLLARAMIFAIAAVSLDFILGGAGLVSFGHAALMGIGAYGVGVLMEHGTRDALVAFPAAMGIAALFALVTGAIAMKTRGVYFIMITLAFGQMAFFVTQSLSAYGGDDGLTLAARSLIGGNRWLRGPLTFHYVTLGLLAASALVCAVILASPFGRVLKAAKENERRVRALGIDPYPYRLAAYVIAGALAGLSGALFANLTEFVSPAFLSWHRSGELIVMVVAGGMAAAAIGAGGTGRLAGAVLGAVGVILVEEGLAHLTEHWRILFGPLLVLLVLVGGAGLRRRRA